MPSLDPSNRPGTSLRPCCGPPGGHTLPFVVQATGAEVSVPLDDLLRWLDDSRAWLESKLLLHGAVLLRGFRCLKGAGELEHLAGWSSGGLMEYFAGIAERSTVRGKIATASETPAPYPIALHQELSYRHDYPDRLILLCETAPRHGGQTPLADMRRVYGKLSPEVRERFEARGCRLQLNLRSGGRWPGTRTWAEMFRTDDRQQVNDIARARGWDVQWLSRGGLRVLFESTPASKVHPSTGEKLWFNSAHLLHPSSLTSELRHQRRYVLWLMTVLFRRLQPSLFWFHSTHADGSPLRETDLEHIRTVLRQETVLVDWQQGDVLLVDNRLVAHGRRPFRGKRRILVALLEDRPAASHDARVAASDDARVAMPPGAGHQPPASAGRRIG